jgi:hypothetical protein
MLNALGIALVDAGWVRYALMAAGLGLLFFVVLYLISQRQS